MESNRIESAIDFAESEIYKTISNGRSAAQLRYQPQKPEDLFESFGEFVVALPPNGLGVRSVRPMKLLRHALLTSGYFAQWTEILDPRPRSGGIRIPTPLRLRIPSRWEQWLWPQLVAPSA